MVLPHAVAVAPNVDDVTIVQQAINRRRGHHLVTEDSAPLLEDLVGSQYRRGLFLTRIDELEKQHRAIATHRQVVDLVDDQQRRMGQHPQPTRQFTRRLGLLQRFYQPGQRAEVNPAPGLGSADGRDGSRRT